MASHRKHTPVSDRDARGKQERVFDELMTDSRLSELREKHALSRGKNASGRLSPDESYELLLLGNKLHVEALKSAPFTPHQRYLKILAGQADYLIVRCSDARIHKTDSEEDRLVGIHIYIAGNVIPGKKTASFEEIAQVAQLVRKDGVCLDEAHCNCGAVKERVKWVEGGMKPTGSTSLDNLLHEVMGPTPSDNAVAQLSKLRKLPGLGGRVTGALFYNWEHGGITIVDASQSPMLELLVDQFNRRHTEANSDGQLARKLSKQVPHAIVVGSNLLPFSIGTIAHALQNEIFQTTGSENGLDDFDEGSVLYAIEHLGVRHIPFIAPATAGNEKSVTAMFDRWESDLRSITVNGKPLVSDMLDSAELAISRLMYDLGSGRLVDLGHR